MSFSSPIDQIKKTEYDDLFFIAMVKENNDPEKLERIRIRIDKIHDEVPDKKLPWAYPMRWRNQGSKGGTIGAFGPIPEKDSLVFVIFQRGDPHFPLYVGGVLKPDLILDLAKTNYPYRYGWVDRAKNEFWVDTKDGQNEVHFKHGTSKSEIVMDNQGNLTGTIKGNANLTVTESMTLDVGEHLSITARSISITSQTFLSLTALAAISIKATANINMSALGMINVFSANIMTLVSALKARLMDKAGQCTPPCK